MPEPYDLTSLTDDRLFGLLPSQLIDDVVGEELEWYLARTPEDIQRRSVDRYNEIAMVDSYERHRSAPLDQQPLRVYYDSHQRSPELADLIGYKHNQIMITANGFEDDFVMLHIGGVYPNSLHLGFLMLENANSTTLSRSKHGSVHKGMGSGISQAIVDNLIALGKELGFDSITGHAIDRDRMDLFCRRGFRVDTASELYAYSLNNNKQIPLKIDLS